MGLGDIDLTLIRKSVVIVDIDGTLANCEHRKHLLETKPKRYDEFYSLVHKDTLIKPVAATVQALSHFYPIIYVSGRRVETRNATIKWLRNNNLWAYPFTLFMRGEGDRRPDVEVKQQILDMLLVEYKLHILLAIDDRNSVVAMWRANGIQCLQVADGDF